MKIKYKLIAALFAVSFVTLILSWFSYYTVSRQAIEDRIIAQLISVSVLKQNDLTDLFAGVTGEIEHVATIDTIYEYMDRVDTDSSSITEGEQTAITNRLNAIFAGGPFTDLFVLSDDGVIAVALSKDRIGETKKEEVYYSEGLQGLYAQNFVLNENTTEVENVLAYPVRNSEGKTVGVVVGIMDLDSVNRLMSVRSGLGETGETYLVNKKGRLVATTDVSAPYALKVVHTDAIDHCISGGSDSGVYKNYRGDRVVGYHTWLPEFGVCLLAEISEAEAFSVLSRLTIISLVLLFILIVVAAIFAIVLTKTISGPITALTNAVQNFGTEPNKSIAINATGEVGVLTTAFNKMIKELHASKMELEQMNAGLVKGINERNDQLEEKNSELQKFNNFMVGRESRMIELKERIKELEQELENCKRK